ncbi:NifU family protein [Sulfurovum sp. zt1-1]|uniref:beta-lactamase n=1 Tax=Sulfurovum zhangzhouensis TaxID=3019067 RepID=A0ABT7QVN8_9BACT|nr:NifU family protein [Sulfurovum zhangzhouensis]MDM5270895.1 NifU family protein [Sulfurovum zhangzhouensis]
MTTLFDKGVSAYENKAYPLAYKHFEEAASEENRDAMVNLAIMHMRGFGCQRDLQEAKNWFEKAASLGHTHAMMSLAHFYEKGMDGAADSDKALEYYVQAANNGMVDAQLKAGMLYREKGNIAKSMQYLITAAHNNNAQAQEIITYVSNVGTEKSYNKMFRSLDEAKQKELVENMIETKIRPTLEADSGGIQLVNFVAGEIPQVWLHYLGACSGCHLGSTSTADMLLDQFEALIDKNVVLYLM